MRIEVNGGARDVEAPCTVGDLVDGAVVDRRGVAVAVDGEVLPRSAWDTTPVHEGIRVEIVGAVQGG